MNDWDKEKHYNFNFTLDPKQMRDYKKEVEIKNAYLKLMIDIGFDYDGYDTVDSLKSLIDELVGYARSALKCETNKMIEKLIEEE